MMHKRGWFERWSAPARGSCLVCGGSTGKAPWQATEDNLRRWQQGLCRACQHQIPWITSIGCRSCGRAIRCSDCQRNPLAAHGLAANRGVVMYDAAMKEWLSRFKYKGERAFATLFAGMMLERYEALWQDTEHKGGTVRRIRMPDIITYVPSSEERLKDRGFNQAELIAKMLANAWQRPLLHMLLRVREDERQSHQSRQGRERSMQGAYQWNAAINRKLQLLKTMEGGDGVVILLIDDVFTTGNTLRACGMAICSELKRYNVEGRVNGYTWARS